MQLLAAMQLLLHGCVWALWAPGALDHGPYGPQGPWAQTLFDCVAVPSGGFFSTKKASTNKIIRLYYKIGVFVYVFVRNRSFYKIVCFLLIWAQGPWGP